MLTTDTLRYELLSRDDHQRSIRAAEQYALQQALRELDDRRREQRRTDRKARGRKYLRLILGRA